MNNVLLSSKQMDWCTPQDFFDRLNEEFDFVLDAAATDKTAKCPLYYTPKTDGLSQNWDRGGAVFCNPPYGREIGKWVQKAYEEAQAGTTIVLLIPARTDTSYFHNYIYHKAGIRFIRGRIRFTDDDGNAADPAPFPSMLVIYNGKAEKAWDGNSFVHGGEASPNEPLTLISMDDKLPPDNERVLVYRPCMIDADVGPYSVQWGWAAKKDGTYWARLPGLRPPEGDKKQ